MTFICFIIFMISIAQAAGQSLGQIVFQPLSNSFTKDTTASINWTRGPESSGQGYSGHWDLRVTYEKSKFSESFIHVHHSYSQNGSIQLSFNESGSVLLEAMDKGPHHVIRSGNVTVEVIETTSTSEPSGGSGNSPTAISSDSMGTTSSVNSHTPSRSAIIAGSVIGAVVLILALLSGILYVRKNRSRRERFEFNGELMVRNPRTASTIPFAVFERARTGDADVTSVNDQLEATEPDSLQSLHEAPTPPSKSLFALPKFNRTTKRDRNFALPVSSEYNRAPRTGKPKKLGLVKVLPSLPSPTSSLYRSDSIRPTNTPRHRMIITPLTDRQLEVQGMIHQLQAKMIRIQSSHNNPDSDKNTIEEIEEEVTITMLKADVEKLKNIRESQWALGVSDDLPKDWTVLRSKYNRTRRR
ncbi:hypothetical protein K435DRAFT_845694 [Dendrothele bispora CBS 962.96]|uniref:Mid2 domain-containing protein n=1 Tax=Dendrothele bispora (strain CBS 962.96) TaxID=1314807 RepID=A0A4S8KST9_DENBC|nr:hypothetical protein K435DRAFT_845694 [Dendrothele bispora CBS 962.96]